MNFAVQHLWVIPACPLLAAAISFSVPRQNRRVSAGIAIAAMIAAFVFSTFALRLALANPALHQTFNFGWFDVGDSRVELGWLLDPLTAVMCVMVSFVSSLIFIFSLGYLKEDANFKQFFGYLSFFAAAMLGLLVANSLLLLFICWELVGVASYLLIGFWFHKPEAAAAAKKAFITTRIGDLGFLLGLIWLYDRSGTLLFFDGGHGVLESSVLSMLAVQTTIGGLAVSTAIGLLLFCGAAGKSGQFPLHVWLPDAMEGPTPVSALIHAATMVAAGVFLMARVYPLMSADQAFASVPVHALTVVAYVGAITALMGACIAVAQNDLKRILAFSTVSQLGYMMLAIGVGSWVAAIFHLLTHAFFKALLFLGAGSVIHASHHEQDIRKLGGLRGSMRTTFVTFGIGMMALCGVPFLFSGFWSKESILHAAHEWDGSVVPFAVGLMAVVLTAFYMTRLMAETFFGRSRSAAAEHAHENSRVMTVPLVVLAVCAIALGFIGTPAWPWLQSVLTGVRIESTSIFAGGALMGVSILLVAVGIGSGWFLYGRRVRSLDTAPDALGRLAPRLFRFLAERMKFDAFYAATVGRLNSIMAILADGFDRFIIGGFVSAIGWLGELTGNINRATDENALNSGFNSVSERIRAAGKSYSRAQTGETHGYLRVLALGFVVLVILVLSGGAR
ncbi:MAG: NADH-quinone oxidoreductase subunit L [Opitutus sp.]